MMKKRKSNLDEMQEQKLLQIEHTGFWIGFFGLAVIIYGQVALGNGEMKYIGGETLVMLVMASYLLYECLKNGIWDRKLKPDLRTNVIISVVTGAAVGLFWGVVSYCRYHALAGSVATFFMMLICVSILIFVLLSITAAIYEKRRKNLDRKADEEENE